MYEAGRVLATMRDGSLADVKKTKNGVWKWKVIQTPFTNPAGTLVEADYISSLRPHPLVS